MLDRIQQFPDQNLLNTSLNGEPRKFQAGKIAEQCVGMELDDKTRHNLIKAFSAITTVSVNTQSRPDMPDNIDGYELWNFHTGKNDGLKIEFGLVEEAPGHIAVIAPTTDLTTVKIGYLNKQLVDAYSINGDQIAFGQWHKGTIEIVLDAEELHEKSELEPAITDDGKYRYEMPFKIANIQYEILKWEGHEENPGILKSFEKNMNAVPVKEMIGSMLERNGQNNPITDVTWHMELTDNEYFKMELISDTRLDGSQLLCIDKTLSYLTRESAYKCNKENHIFEQYVNTDDAFLKVIYDTFETRMVPRCSDIFKKQSFKEVMTEPKLVLTNEDLKGLGSIDNLSI